MKDQPAAWWYFEEGQKHAATKLKELVRAAHATRTPASSPLGDQILEAVEALPDRTKLMALPEETRASLEEFLLQTEISFHAKKLQEAVDLNFPERQP